MHPTFRVLITDDCHARMDPQAALRALVAAGVVDVRLSDVDTDYRGRVAIHAAAGPEMTS